MSLGEAKDLIKKSITYEAFKKEDFLSLASITESNLQWVMDFKTLSTNKEFLEAFVQVFDNEFAGVSEVQVCGMESGALPFIAAVSLLSPKCKNAFYIRKSSKKYDLAKTIEGHILKEIPIIIIDDILNQGNTINKQKLILEEQGHSPHACFTILRYQDTWLYKNILGTKIQIKSIFELNDFSKTLHVTNLSNIKIPNYSAWEGVWKIKLSKSNPYLVVPKSGPVCDDKCIYIGSDDGCMRAISKNDGKIMWEFRVSFGGGGKRILSSPALYRSNLFFGGYDGNFYCLDTVTGKVKWVFTEADWIGSSPSVSVIGDYVYIGLEFGLFKKKGGVVAIDIKTGEAKWRYYEMTGFTHASPVSNVKLGIVVCGCNDNFVYCFDRKKGILLWKFETKGEVKYGAAFDEKRKLVIIAGMDGGLYCINVKTGTLYHRFSAQAGFYSTPILSGDQIIIGSLDKKTYCFDLLRKATIWTTSTRGRIFASPVRHENSIFIGSNEGAVYELDIDTGKTLSLIQLTERVVNKIIVEKIEKKITLYIPTHACELYKFTKNI